MNSEEFRETFLRNDREGPTKAEKAGEMAENNAWRKKKAERKAGLSGQKGKAGSPEKAKSGSRRGWRRKARRTQLQPVTSLATPPAFKLSLYQVPAVLINTQETRPPPFTFTSTTVH